MVWQVGTSVSKVHETLFSMCLLTCTVFNLLFIVQVKVATRHSTMPHEQAT